ncbi:MAG TPA: CotH kinase family protein [Polyangiaceae bacterium]
MVGGALLTSSCLSACGGDELVRPPPEPEPPLTHENLYSLEVIPTFRLELDDAAVAALAAEPKEYTRGTFSDGNVSIENVGVRLKGNDTLRTLDEKPSFKLKFNEFVSGQRYLGFEGLTLNNMAADPSMLREWLGYEVFRRYGVPAPRTGYATLEVNGEAYGLYLNIEPYNDDFLERNFDDPSGNLYEGDHGDDVQRDVQNWDQDEGLDTSRADLLRLQAAMSGEVESYFYGESAPIATDEFFGFIAAEAFVGHFDGYQSPHNYFIYNEPAPDLWSFLPWNLDQSFYRATSAFFGAGYLTRACIDSSERCLLDYTARTLARTRALAAEDLPSSLAATRQRIGFAARGDVRKTHSQASMESSADQLAGWLAARVPAFEAEVDCLVDGKQTDADGDGFGTCTHDCDDTDPGVHFSASEVCDQVDNDCSGFIDDVAACACPSEVIDGVEFYFCTHVIKWYKAREFCAAQGHQLAKIDTEAQNAKVWEVAQGMRQGAWSIGLTDSATEGEFRFLDGTEPSFTTWAPGEPAQRLPIFDCVYLKSGSEPAWYEGNCNEVGAFVCSALP